MRDWPVWNGPCAVVDPMHVETFFDRNLGGLIHARYGIRAGSWRHKPNDEQARG